MEISVESKIPIRFFIITFLWSWLLFSPLVLIGMEIIPLGSDFLAKYSLPFIGLAAFGPAVGAIFSLRSLNGKGAVKNYFESFFSLRFGWKVWIAIFLVLGLSSFIAWILPELWGETRLPMLLPNIFVFPVYLLLMIFLGGGQEEIGWRGYILPYLENKFGFVFGSLILGIVWAIWHLPLWFIPGTSQGYMSFFAFMLLTIGYSYFFSWIIEASGKRLFSGLIVHGAANSFMPLFPTLAMVQNANQIRWWIYCVLILIIGTIIVIKRTRHKERKTSA
jgi:membrane protease YdiL (CAAX protease family)